MVTTAKVKNASPHTGTSCRSVRICVWLRPRSAWALALLFLGLGLAVFPAAPAQAAIAFDVANSYGNPTDIGNKSPRERETCPSWLKRYLFLFSQAFPV